MNMTHLRAFHLVASHGSYSVAATAAGVSQPTLSEQVRRLQMDHGVLLLHRTRGGMETTSKGEELFKVTRRIFAAERDAELLLSTENMTVQARLRLGADAPVHAVPVLKRLRELHPGVKISISSGNSAGIRAQVLSGALDAGIVADATTDPLLTTQVLTTQDLVAVVLRDSALTAMRTASVHILNSQPVVIREQGSVTRSATEEAFLRWNVVPSEVTEAGSREAVEASVLAGLGTGLMGEVEFSHDPRLALVDFNEGLPPLVEYIVHRTDRGNDPALRAVLAAALGPAGP